MRVRTKGQYSLPRIAVAWVATRCRGAVTCSCGGRRLVLSIERGGEEA